MGNFLQRIWHYWWNVLTLRTKLVICGIAAVLFAVTWFYSCKDTKPAIEDETSYKVLQGENNLLREQNVALRQEADASMARGQSLEMERDGLRVELEKFGKQAAAGVQKQKEAGEIYEKEILVIGADIDIRERCRRYCTTRADVGYPCSATYCDRYAIP